MTPALATELGEVLEEHGDEAERYVLTSLINEIHQSGTRMTLVIDDWHRVTDPATIAALRYLLDNICRRADRGGDQPQPGRAADEPDADAGRTGRNRRHRTAFRHRRIGELSGRPEWVGPGPQRRRGAHRQDRRLGGGAAAGIAVAARPRGSRRG